MRTLERPPAQLHKLFQDSPEGREAADANLQLGDTAWREHMSCKQYQFRRPCIAWLSGAAAARQCNPTLRTNLLL